MCERSLRLKQHSRDHKHAKSFTNIPDFFGHYPYEITADKCKRKGNRCSNRNYGQQIFVVNEKFNVSNNSSHINGVFPSTSTIFYDLDDLVNRHSFHSVTDLSPPRKKIVEVFKQPARYSKRNPTFKKGSTHLQYMSHDSPMNRSDIDAKRVRRKSKAQSETKYIIQKGENEIKHCKNNHNFDKKTKKPLCYAKYTVQYNKSKQNKLNDGDSDVRRVEDPCPCQLFSYVCPCIENKSHISLSKSKTFLDQITSTIRKGPNTERKMPVSKDNRITCTSFEKSQQKENIVENEQANIYTCEKVESVNNNHSEKQKKSRKYNIKCPKCKQEFSVHSVHIKQCQDFKNGQSFNYLSPKNDVNDPTYSVIPDNVAVQANVRICNHNPQCEMVPACQILPTTQVALTQITRNDGILYDRHHNKPRIIRVTKACRHHPPCTVVPSCQREYLKENHCDIIPPCMHKPHCINLPMCVPFTKNCLNYEQSPKTVENAPGLLECNHVPRCKLVPACHNNIHDTQNNQQLYYPQPPYSPYLYSIYPMQQRCEVPYSQPEDNISNETKDRGSTSKRSCVTDNKSCQCASSENKPKNNTESGSEAVIYIRDVGCQFRNKSENKKEVQNIARETINSCDINKVKVHNNGYTNPERLLNQTSTTTSWSQYSEKEVDSTYDTDWKHLKKQSFTKKCSPTFYKDNAAEQSRLINKNKKKGEKTIEVLAYPLICDNYDSFPLAEFQKGGNKHESIKIC